MMTKVPSPARLLASALMASAIAAPGLALAQATTDPYPAWNAKVAADLHLNAEQQAALKVFEAAYFNGALVPAGLTPDQYHVMALPDRLHFTATNLTADATTIREREAAARKFYATLSTEQQTQFDALMDPMRGRAGVAADATPLPALVEKNYQLPSHTLPDWMVRPTADDISRVYPSAALAKHVEGAATLTCTVDEDGYVFDCVVDTETPPGMGFGNAALEITAYMRMKPATDYGVPVRSAVTVPIGFTFPKGG
jgi:TonB family protein